jgi:hypothetical protein
VGFWSTFGPQLAQSGLRAVFGDIVPSNAPVQQNDNMRGMLGVRNVMGWPGMIQDDDNPMSMSRPDVGNPALGNVVGTVKRGI